MPKRRNETWLAVSVLAVLLIPAAILGRWVYSGATAEILHPDPNNVPSVEEAETGASPRWAGAVDAARHIVRAGLNGQNLPALSVAVGINGDVVWAEAFGWADLEERILATPDMTFRIGTASTVLTSAAAGVLLEEGLLKLDDTIQTYVPGFPEKAWPVTLRHLMGHTAGMANDGGDEGPLFSESCQRPADALQFLRGHERELRFEPGTRFSYSSYGWILVSAAIEAAADEPFLTFMQKEVFEPLGLRHTTPEFDAAPAPNRVTQYFPRFASDPRYGLHLMRPLNYSCYAGSSVFLSTPSDLVRFGMAINEGKLLKSATVQVLQAPQRLASGEDTGYGLGWDLEGVSLAGESTRWAGHDGRVLGGMAASLITFPERGLAVSVMSNISYADAETIALDIAQAFAAPQ